MNEEFMRDFFNIQRRNKLNWYYISLFTESNHPQTKIYRMQAHSAADAEYIVNFNLKKSTPQRTSLYGIACADETNPESYPLYTPEL